ncbi:5'-nucleotidase [Acaryochloris thomasi RCC1774]|uniref:5'-nucleotidase n=1 Tax=Acaryochloris thomasi RCC1774 TaxID=1764569 RepID=A0A2W1JB02_9CYAN|nr:HAD-IA family hydrolase [Acaryochloris thomasi]PZD71290.1 5'-nucleotidase [Acaryochloris thomasi RCC1774]
MTVIAFDLDGTLSDPAVGITASINYALENLGAAQQTPESLTQYIGPPLDEIFSTLLKTENTAIIEQAISSYRERYFSIGYTENILYTGVRGVLSNLVQNGDRLYIATSKRTDIAKAVVEYLELQSYFVQVLGCGRKRQKHELLQEIIGKESAFALVMIGDRSHDMHAGRSVSATCIGVLWGYGSAAELKHSGAEILLQHPQEILGYLT